METRRLGQSGLEVSLVGLGFNNFGGMKASLGAEEGKRVVHAALDSGIALFDTAESYGNDGASESILGDALGARRKDAVVATKFASALGRQKWLKHSGSRSYIIGALEGSLRRLKTDYIDLYQYHTPDPRTPMEETLRALDDLIRQGKVRYIGCSQMQAWQIVDASWMSRHLGLNRFVSTQAEFNLLERKAETTLLPALRAAGVGLLPYFPLASGMLTGKYRKGGEVPAGSRMTLAYFDGQLTPQRLEKIEQIIAFAQSRGRTILEAAMGWLAAKPEVGSIIAGATTPEQVAQNVRAAEWKLDADELRQLDQIAAS